MNWQVFDELAGERWAAQLEHLVGATTTLLFKPNSRAPRESPVAPPVLFRRTVFAAVLSSKRGTGQQSSRRTVPFAA